MTRLILVGVALAFCVIATPGAMAQSRGRGGSSSSDDNLPPSVPPKVSTLVPVRGISGPRLEPGAVICGTEEDLQRRTEVSRRIADGDASPGNPMLGCRMLNEERGVEILSRHGLALSQVKLKPSGEIGWTDAYLR